MKYRLFLLFALSIQMLDAQSEYWQQRVEYTISVTLDDQRHMLYGQEKFVYRNNSPHALDSLYIHVWPNAYRDRTSALAQQQYRDGEAHLRYGPEEDKGWMDSLDFRVNGMSAPWNYHHCHKDIVILHLASPLQPGNSLIVETPFRVKIPSGEISRLGHIEESYQITQWYPKPAVFDKNGWHQMPYLNQGEFYSEYGSFDVSITLPENYIVGATGDLQTESEIRFMEEQVEKTKHLLDSITPRSKKGYPNTIPPSSARTKTIRYVQDNVHDFAWFADKRYYVLKGEVILPHSGRIVTSWAMFTPKNTNLWKPAIEYINDGVYYYSLWNGDYPYNQVTAVDGTISAGGGMEYPNVTVIGDASKPLELETVIVHEVGHNWFYGQLGTNERVHGWMDEGINTLNEVRYIQTKYPKNTALSEMLLGGMFHLKGLDHHDSGDYGYRAIAGLGEDQPIETHSNDFSSINYGIIMYQKTGLVFYYLKDYLGEELFDTCMQTYYREWEFKHPQPEDLRHVFERVSGKDLSWFFGDLIQTTNHVDYKICRVKRKGENYTVTVRNSGQVDGPIEVAAMVGDSVARKQWVEPGAKKSTVEFSGDFDFIRIDPENDIPELNRQNNNWKQKGLFGKMERPKVEFLFGDKEPNRTMIFWSPIVGGNYYDKFMIGVGVHNYGIPYSKYNFLLMPYYSFGRQFVSGVAEISKNCLPKNGLKRSQIGLSVKSFKHDTTYRYNDSYFITVSPYWMAKIGNRKFNSPVSQYVKLQALYRKDKYGPTHIEHAGAFLEYDYTFSTRDHKIHVNARNEYLTNTNTSDEYGRATLEVEYSFRYKKEEGRRLIKGRGSKAAKGWISVRGFIGKQYLSHFDKAVNGYQYSMSLAGTDGKQDWFTEEYYFGRNAISGIWSQQRQDNMGGFKTTSYYGTTSDMLTSGNLYIQLPVKPGIFGLFADVGAFWNNTGSSVKVNSAADAGAAIRLGDTFSVYFPIWMSKQLSDSFGNSHYGTKIRFSVHFNLFRKPLQLKGIL